MPTKRVVSFVDGFNVYHALDQTARSRGINYKWLNLKKLSEAFLKSSETLTETFYFTALAHWNVQKVQRHKKYVQALRHHGVETVFGQFKLVDKRCRSCRNTFQTFEEKETDVNIAIMLLRLAYENRYDKALIISGDSDLLPAVRAVKSVFPSKEIQVVIPIGGRAEALKQETDSHMKMKEKHLRSSQLPNPITLPNNQAIQKPHEWN